MNTEVCVIGAGVVGLSTALRIIEVLKGQVDITIIADQFFNQTTSFVSAGYWQPYQISGTPEDIVNNWGQISFNHFLDLYYSHDVVNSGVKLLPVFTLFKEDQACNIPSWHFIPFSFRLLNQEDIAQMKLPLHYVQGHTCNTLVIDQKYYLLYLMNKLKSFGVKFVQRRLNSIKELYHDDYSIIVNCSGLGSVVIANDDTMYPVRGQVVRIIAPWLQSVWHFGTSYIIPQIDTCVIGGTAEKGLWDTNPSFETTQTLLTNASEIFPGITTARIESVSVGLRPGRAPLRLASEVITLDDASNDDVSTSKQVLVCHNYGHGGSGVTLAYGCAQDLVLNHILPWLQRVA